ncbi:MAG: N-6 DNA methylase [Erysipelotrichaceae bacterium]|nr:N-6 DNA methylase [Erysipelotrichaceae bacterium]
MDFKEIIHLMGYDNFDNYYYFNEIDKSSLSYHDKKVLKILKPLSFYVQDNKILIVFFNDIQKRENNLAVQLWNSQIPFILSDEGSCIKLYTTKNVNITNNEIKLVSIDTISRNEIDTYSFLNYWNLTDELYLQKYDRNLTHKSINDYLIENLQYLTDILNNRYHITKAYKLILRVLFIRYLIDRGINIGYKDFSDNVEENQKYFLSFFDDNHELYNLFLFLKDKFNGNLFEISNDEDILSIPHDALIYIKDFLSGDIELKSGQLSLFSLYDFNIIPIEIISNVYEILLGKDNQKKDKAFYTPEYLVDYILSDTVKKHLNHNNECKVFDPSCGSGIFLVMALRLILDKNTNNEGYIDDNDKLINLVINNIYGIDYNDEAIDVTIFSLYVTMLDFKNTKTLDDFKFPNLKNDNLITMDFFDDNISHIYKDINFDFVLGNPPWGKVQNQSSYIQYMRNNNIILPDNEICIAFMFKLYKECLDSTNITLIIPSKILYKKKSSSKSFRQRLLEETIITKITELSSVRKMLFKGAYAPATIISFHNTSSYTFDNKIEYISIKPHKILNYYHLLLIEPEDIKYVKQGLLSANDWAWKTIVYGTYHDFENIKKLLYHYNTLGDISQNEKFLISRGIETHNGDEKDASHLIGKNF